MPDKPTEHFFKIRMTSAIKEHLEQAAEKNRRSMTNEILSRLEASVGIEKVEEADSEGAPTSLSKDEAALLSKMWTLLDETQREAILAMIGKLIL